MSATRPTNLVRPCASSHLLLMLLWIVTVAWRLDPCTARPYRTDPVQPVIRRRLGNDNTYYQYNLQDDAVDTSGFSSTYYSTDDDDAQYYNNPNEYDSTTTNWQDNNRTTASPNNGTLFVAVVVAMAAVLSLCLVCLCPCCCWYPVSLWDLLSLHLPWQQCDDECYKYTSECPVCDVACPACDVYVC